MRKILCSAFVLAMALGANAQDKRESVPPAPPKVVKVKNAGQPAPPALVRRAPVAGKAKFDVPPPPPPQVARPARPVKPAPAHRAPVDKLKKKRTVV